MYQRIFDINKELDMSVFLFGARQTGKSTLLRKAVSKAVYIDLLDSDIRKLYRKRPAYLYDQLAGKDSSCVVIIDEIPEVPDLLNEVHRLISEFGIRFVLCGSSARKLKRKGYNTLGGRAFPCYFYPLVSAEIPDLDIDRAVNNGMMPLHYPAKNATRLLASYVDVYLKEEIQAEALVRDLDNFERFLEVAALTDGEMVNYANIASDCGVSAKRRLVQAPRFYFFDVGVANYLLHRQNLVRGTVEFGHAFEHWVIQEIIAFIGYTHNENRLSYWRTYTGIEVDAVIGDARLAIEIKSVAEVLPKHLTGLKTFMEEHPDTRPIIVSLDRISRRCGEMESLYVMDFLRMLWAGELF